MKLVTPELSPPQTGEVFLEASMRALLDGCFEGLVSMADLARRGDFGLGTFDSLDGELVACEGKFYQFTSDGQAREVSPEQTSPFALIKVFQPQKPLALEGELDFGGFVEALLPRLGQQIYALRVRARFASVRVRVIHRCEKPYPSFGNVATSEFTREDIAGSLIGFHFPDELQSLAGPVWHLHFLSDDRKFGGHVLDFKGTDLEVELDLANRLRVALPPGREGDYDALSGEQEALMRRVEYSAG